MSSHQTDDIRHSPNFCVLESALIEGKYRNLPSTRTKAKTSNLSSVEPLPVAYGRRNIDPRERSRPSTRRFWWHTLPTPPKEKKDPVRNTGQTVEMPGKICVTGAFFSRSFKYISWADVNFLPLKATYTVERKLLVSKKCFFNFLYPLSLKKYKKQIKNFGHFLEVGMPPKGGAARGWFHALVFGRAPYRVLD